VVVKRSCKICLLFLDPALRIRNNAGHTRSHGDWNPTGKCHDLLHEGVTLTKWRSMKILLAWIADVTEAASLY